jgi:hypothetical protein
MPGRLLMDALFTHTPPCRNEDFVQGRSIAQFTKAKLSHPAGAAKSRIDIFSACAYKHPCAADFAASLDRPRPQRLVTVCGHFFYLLGYSICKRRDRAANTFQTSLSSSASRACATFSSIQWYRFQIGVLVRSSPEVEGSYCSSRFCITRKRPAASANRAMAMA